MCHSKMVKPDVDLLFIEYVTNDFALPSHVDNVRVGGGKLGGCWLTSGAIVILPLQLRCPRQCTDLRLVQLLRLQQMQAYERLLRKILKRKNRPAVVLMQVGGCQGPRTQSHAVCEAMGTPLTFLASLS